jgi:polygalacturonase
MRFIDYKQIGCFNNSDGCDVVSSHNVIIRDCFFRQWDDITPIKGMDMGNVHNVEISNVIAWSDKAQVFEIGYETRCDTIRDVYVHDCTVIHALSRPVVSIHAGDHAYITNIRYENITVEHGVLNDFNPYLIDLWIGTSTWTKEKERGHINGITIKNLSFLSGSFGACRIAGYDADHRVENVTIENLKIIDKYVLYPEDGKFNINEHTSNIKFLQTKLN